MKLQACLHMCFEAWLASKCLDSYQESIPIPSQATYASEMENTELCWFIDNMATRSSYLSACISNCGRYVLTIDHRITWNSEWLVGNESHEMWPRLLLSLNIPPAPTNPALLNPLFPTLGHHGLENPAHLHKQNIVWICTVALRIVSGLGQWWT